MVHVLLDEHISPKVAAFLGKKSGSIRVSTLQSWQGGRFLGVSDDILLEIAHQHSLTLVTYDLRTIPPLLKEFSLRGQAHAGVVLVDRNSIKPSDIGGLGKALVSLWERECNNSWHNRVCYLQKNH